MMYIQGGVIEINNCKIEGSTQGALTIVGSNMTIDSNTVFKDNDPMIVNYNGLRRNILC